MKIYRFEQLMEDGHWLGQSPPSFHRPEREMVEARRLAIENAYEGETLAFRIVEAEITEWRPEPSRAGCVVEDCEYTVDSGHSYCGLHRVSWGRS